MAFVIGSISGEIPSDTTFLLEVVCKHTQVLALNGRQFNYMLHSLMNILEKGWLIGLYRGLGPTCIILIHAADIFFMCYESSLRIDVENEQSC
ncbi:unnamed protein product [Lupinus luteus]|uniref:Uncharacterized protein n=1 Tax=Lupinus luteus TaxID=3873 RepID=A0AAV1Y0R5_LUPLU